MTDLGLNLEDLESQESMCISVSKIEEDIFKKIFSVKNTDLIIAFTFISFIGVFLYMKSTNNSNNTIDDDDTSPSASFLTYYPAKNSLETYLPFYLSDNFVLYFSSYDNRSQKFNYKIFSIKYYEEKREFIIESHVNYSKWKEISFSRKTGKGVFFDDFALKVYNFKTKKYEEIDQNISFKSAAKCYHPTINLDGNKISFVSDDERKFKIIEFIENSHWGNLKEIEGFDPSNDRFPTISNDGNSIFYLKRHGKHFDLFKLSEESKEEPSLLLSKLSNSLITPQLTFSNDNSKFVYFDSDKKSLIIIELDKGEIITELELELELPPIIHFWCDGDKIILLSFYIKSWDSYCLHEYNVKSGEIKIITGKEGEHLRTR